MNVINIKRALCALLLTFVAVAPAFGATSGNQEFDSIIVWLEGALEGGLGVVLILVGLVVASIAAVARQSIGTFLFVFGLTLIMRFGPDILISLFSATLPAQGVI